MRFMRRSSASRAMRPRISSGTGDAEQVEHGRRDVEQVRVERAARADSRAGGDPHARPARGSRRPGRVVLEGVDALVAADRPDRAPEQVAEDDDQVGRDAVDLVVQLLRLVDLRRDRLAVLVGDRGDARGEVVAHALVVGGRDRALRLAALDVEEDARVVAAVAPRRRARPVDAGLLRRRDAVGLALEREQALAAQPLVDADAAVEPLRAVVGDDEDERVVVGVLEQAADQPVEVDVVVADRVLVSGCPARACGARRP